MQVIESVRDMKSFRRAHTAESIGFVPTMGALHAGHLALVERAKRENAHAVVSIFVNPTQFNDPKDLAAYPQPLHQDLELLRATGASAVFLPNAREIYADDYHYLVHETHLSGLLCGPGRPGHFDGMLTVVLKLLNAVEAERAYFGEKDYQQLRLIEGMAKAFFLNTAIVPCPTVREKDGLAMSSRNLRLTSEERARAPRLYQILQSAADVTEARRELEAAGFAVEYVEEHWGRRFAAARLGSVRLIDNVAL